VVDGEAPHRDYLALAVDERLLDPAGEDPIAVHLVAGADAALHAEDARECLDEPVAGGADDEGRALRVLVGTDLVQHRGIDPWEDAGEEAWRHAFDVALRDAVQELANLREHLCRSLVRRATQAKMTVAEQHLLELILPDTELRDQVLGLLEETDYETLATAPIFAALYELQQQKLEPTVERLLNLVGGDEYFGDLVPLLMMSEPKRSAGDVIDDVFHDAENCIFTLRSMPIQNRLHDLSHELIEAEQTGDNARISHIVAEHLDLSKMHHSLLNKIAQT